MFEKEIEAPLEVKVLGKTFASDEERRTYFREELRKKLPELKKMQGFPIGKDEDIITLSDPPFYTACPNPWLNDFIGQWEADKKESTTRVNHHKVDSPFASDVSVGKNNPIYNAHSYHTKVPHPAIMRYILHYTQPGDIIFDGFAGTGMTGVAAQLCGKPGTKIKSEIEKEFLNQGRKTPVWGVRRAILGDLSPIASFIAYNYNVPVDIIAFEQETQNILTEVEAECGWMYETRHTNGQLGQINYTVWSDIFICNHCREEMVFWEEAIDKEAGKVQNEFNCPHCEAINIKRKMEKAWKTKYDATLKQTIRQVKSIPVLIIYTLGKKRYEKIPDSDDLSLIDKIEQMEVPYWFPKDELPNGYNTQQPVRSHGVSHVHHFYTKRNLWCLAALLNKIANTKTKHSGLIHSSIVNRSTQMNRIHLKNFFFGGGGWNAGYLKGTLYISSIPIETSIFKQIESRIKSFIRAFSTISNQIPNLINTSSATSQSIKANSIDYIFTDPPFGANLMYSELNFLWESWLKVKTNNKQEAIENKVQGKNFSDYTRLMTDSFREYYRILKPSKWMTVEFSNTNAGVWNGIQLALQQAGFIVANVAALDKKQGSFKAVTTTTAVKQDLVISCYKPSSEFDQKFTQNQNEDVAVWNFVEEHLQHLPLHVASDNSTTVIIERNPKILFDRLIAYYVLRGLAVPLNADKFQQGLRERFIERDRMFFTNEQVQEYDKKKKEFPDVIQLSIIISSEQDGVLWLKNLLHDKSLAYQDIQPLWMQALAGKRKGDIIPELAEILEENFLKDTNGKWYLPDPENEADLEKLRNKRLQKQFDIYKEIAAKPKGKIKECRVDALRVGFKQCYQDKDFKTIVLVGDRIPNNLLMEDEVLLQFYDIASSRV